MFKIKIKDKKSKARLGILETAHGEIMTPVFMPVGTKATVKTLSPEDLEKLGAEVILGNTYHLYLQPGDELIAKLGGLHKFMGWNKPILTDSGGFQVFSLRETRQNSGSRSDLKNEISRSDLKNEDENGQHLCMEVSDRGCTFRDPRNGTKHFFTPEKVMEIQRNLGADIIMAFDECTSYPATREQARRSMELTHRWAKRCVEKFQMTKKTPSPQPSPTEGRGGENEILALDEKGTFQPLSLDGRGQGEGGQLLFGIVQGSVFKDLREESAQFITSLPFDGIAVGGVSVGESKKEMYEVLDWVEPLLPENRPRYVMGIGTPEDLLECIERGYDMFDCVLPTRMARNGAVWIREGGRGNKCNRGDKGGKTADGLRSDLKNEISRSDLRCENGRVDLTKSIFKDDPKPIMEGCKCYACQNFSRAYINHLLRSKEILGIRLTSIHNLHFLLALVKQARAAIKSGSFSKFKKDWLKGWKAMSPYGGSAEGGK